MHFKITKGERQGSYEQISTKHFMKKIENLEDGQQQLGTPHTFKNATFEFLKVRAFYTYITS